MATPEPYADAAYFYQSDHVTFSKLEGGEKPFFFFTGGTLVKSNSP